MIFINIRIPNLVARWMVHTHHIHSVELNENGKWEKRWQRKRKLLCRITYFRCLRQRRLYVFTFSAKNSKASEHVDYVAGRVLSQSTAARCTHKNAVCRSAIRPYARLGKHTYFHRRQRVRCRSHPDANGNFLVSSVPFAICAVAFALSSICT